VGEGIRYDKGKLEVIPIYSYLLWMPVCYDSKLLVTSLAH
jgi:hypothetical protein